MFKIKNTPGDLELPITNEDRVLADALPSISRIFKYKSKCEEHMHTCGLFDCMLDTSNVWQNVVDHYDDLYKAISDYMTSLALPIDPGLEGRTPSSAIYFQNVTIKRERDVSPVDCAINYSPYRINVYIERVMGLIYKPENRHKLSNYPIFRKLYDGRFVYLKQQDLTSSIPTVLLFSIPLMVGSKQCWSRDPENHLIEGSYDPMNRGGYFVVGVDEGKMPSLRTISSMSTNQVNYPMSYLDGDTKSIVTRSTVLHLGGTGINQMITCTKAVPEKHIANYFTSRPLTLTQAKVLPHENPNVVYLQFTSTSEMRAEGRSSGAHVSVPIRVNAIYVLTRLYRNINPSRTTMQEDVKTVYELMCEQHTNPIFQDYLTPTYMDALMLCQQETRMFSAFMADTNDTWLVSNIRDYLYLPDRFNTREFLDACYSILGPEALVDHRYYSSKFWYTADLLYKHVGTMCDLLQVDNRDDINTRSIATVDIQIYKQFVKKWTIDLRSILTENGWYDFSKITTVVNSFASGFGANITKQMETNKIESTYSHGTQSKTWTSEPLSDKSSINIIMHNTTRVVGKFDQHETGREPRLNRLDQGGYICTHSTPADTINAGYHRQLACLTRISHRTTSSDLVDYICGYLGCDATPVAKINPRTMVPAQVFTPALTDAVPIMVDQTYVGHIDRSHYKEIFLYVKKQFPEASVYLLRNTLFVKADAGRMLCPMLACDPETGLPLAYDELVEFSKATSDWHNGDTLIQKIKMFPELWKKLLENNWLYYMEPHERVQFNTAVEWGIKGSDFCVVHPGCIFSLNALHVPFINYNNGTRVSYSAMTFRHWCYFPEMLFLKGLSCSSYKYCPYGERALIRTSGGVGMSSIMLGTCENTFTTISAMDGGQQEDQGTTAQNYLDNGGMSTVVTKIITANYQDRSFAEYETCPAIAQAVPQFLLENPHLTKHEGLIVPKPGSYIYDDMVACPVFNTDDRYAGSRSIKAPANTHGIVTEVRMRVSQDNLDRDVVGGMSVVLQDYRPGHIGQKVTNRSAQKNVVGHTPKHIYHVNGHPIDSIMSMTGLPSRNTPAMVFESFIGLLSVYCLEYPHVRPFEAIHPACDDSIYSGFGKFPQYGCVDSALPHAIKDEEAELFQKKPNKQLVGRKFKLMGDTVEFVDTGKVYYGIIGYGRTIHSSQDKDQARNDENMMAGLNIKSRSGVAGKSKKGTVNLGRQEGSIITMRDPGIVALTYGSSSSNMYDQILCTVCHQLCYIDMSERKVVICCEGCHRKDEMLENATIPPPQYVHVRIRASMVGFIHYMRAWGVNIDLYVGETGVSLKFIGDDNEI